MTPASDGAPHLPLCHRVPLRSFIISKIAPQNPSFRRQSRVPLMTSHPRPDWRLFGRRCFPLPGLVGSALLEGMLLHISPISWFIHASVWLQTNSRRGIRPVRGRSVYGSFQTCVSSLKWARSSTPTHQAALAGNTLYIQAVACIFGCQEICWRFDIINLLETF